MLAKKQKPLSQIYQDLVSKVGAVFSERVNLKFSGNGKEKFMDKLLANTPTKLASLKVKEVNRLDGAKLILEDGSWILARPSGTEPLIRVYAEAETPEKMQALLRTVKDLV